MLAATLLSLGAVFLAELGDRSQLITMTYTLRYRWWVVLTGVAIAAFTVHGVAVAIGHFLGSTVPARPAACVSAIAFLIFAVWVWREDTASDSETSPTAAEPRLALFTVVSSFALAELGDKTTLATVTLASDHHWAGVWIGTTLGNDPGRRPGDRRRAAAAPAPSGAVAAGPDWPAVPAVRTVVAVRRRVGLQIGCHRRDSGGGAGRGNYGGIGAGGANSSAAANRCCDTRR